MAGSSNKPSAEQSYRRGLLGLCLMRASILAAAVLRLVYLVWRVCKLPGTDLLITVPLLVNEFGSAIQTLIFYLIAWGRKDADGTTYRELQVPVESWPSVDVMIPCYNEPVDVVGQTTEAAMLIDWPADRLHVYVLDDGNSQECRAMVEGLAAEQLDRQEAGEGAATPQLSYVARVKLPGQPHHAKAGNLNHAILEAGSSGEFILVMDCDHVAQPGIVQALLPHFHEPQAGGGERGRLAMVQSGQTFGNVAAKDPLNDQQPIFYRVIMPGYDFWDSAPCCGTNVLFRRRALEAIGGFSTGTITEDFLTSLSLKTHGFSTRYHDAVLATGLAPEGLDAFFGQRSRWTLGALQILLQHRPWQGRPRLTGMQRVLYTWVGLRTFLSVTLLYSVVVGAARGLGLPFDLIRRDDVATFWMLFLATTLADLLTTVLVTGPLGAQRWRYIFRMHQESLVLLFSCLQCCVTIMTGKQVGFRVTPKDRRAASPYEKDLGHVTGHLALGLLCSLALLRAAVTLAYAPPLAAEDRSELLGYAVFMAYVLIGLWPPVGVFIRTHILRRGPMQVSRLVDAAVEPSARGGKRTKGGEDDEEEAQDDEDEDHPLLGKPSVMARRQVAAFA